MSDEPKLSPEIIEAMRALILGGATIECTIVPALNNGGHRKPDGSCWTVADVLALLDREER